jgi:hypothetical protein
MAAGGEGDLGTVQKADAIARPDAMAAEFVRQGCTGDMPILKALGPCLPAFVLSWP